MHNSGAHALGVKEFVLLFKAVGKSERKCFLTGLGERYNIWLSSYGLITAQFIAIMSKKAMQNRVC